MRKQGAEVEEKGKVINICTRQKARGMERARPRKAGGHEEVRGTGLVRETQRGVSWRIVDTCCHRHPRL